MSSEMETLKADFHFSGLDRMGRDWMGWLDQYSIF